jgi:hypothetical protein
MRGSAGKWINCGNLRAFVAVTESTGEPEIIFFVAPAFSARHKMFNFECGHDEALRAQAVTATVMRGFAHTPPECFRNLRRGHD